MQFYEVRTFRRGLQTFSEYQSQWILAIPFRVRLFDFQERQRLISEEQGALIWESGSNQVIHQEWQDGSVSHVERAVIEQSEGTICLDFQGESPEPPAVNSRILQEPPNRESMMFFDAETLRYDRRYSIDNPSQSEHCCREIGELVRMGLQKNRTFSDDGFE